MMQEGGHGCEPLSGLSALAVIHAPIYKQYQQTFIQKSFLKKIYSQWNTFSDTM